MKKRIQFNSLREWREARQLSQRAAAAQFGVSQGCWNKIELRVRSPRKALLERLVGGTGLRAETILGIGL